MNVKARINKEERELIEQEAELLGLTVSAFMRWCGVHVAHELHKSRVGPAAAGARPEWSTS